MCVIVLNLIKIALTVADKWWFNGFLFQNGGRPPSWICSAPTGTTHDDHLMVSIVVPNLVKINAVVSITWNFQYFARLAWKRLLTPQNWGFGGISPPKWGAISTRPPKGTSAGRNGSSGVLIILAKARDYGFTGVGLSVCLSVCLFVCYHDN